MTNLLSVEGESHALYSSKALVLCQLAALLEQGCSHPLATKAPAMREKREVRGTRIARGLPY